MNDASVAFIFVILGVAVYFIPWMVAVRNNKRLALMIGFFNIFFAWTVIGWLFLLVWASGTAGHTAPRSVSPEEQVCQRRIFRVQKTDDHGVASTTENPSALA